jgi:hypothetical protein
MYRTVLLLVALLPALAVAGQEVPPAPMKPQVPDRSVNTRQPFFDPADRLKSCMALDDEISLLVTKARYAEKADFYNDPNNAVSAVIGISGLGLGEAALLYWIYAEAERYGIQDRVEAIHRRVDALRRVKAKKRCYET